MTNKHDLMTLTDRILVPHSAFSSGLERLELCLSYVIAGAREPVCIALTGESRTGKSRLAETLSSVHPSRRFEDGLEIPILTAMVPATPTVKNLAETLLQQLGVEDWHLGSEAAQTRRLVTLMIRCKVRLLVLDEFQHFYDKGSHRVQHAVADWLKNLVGIARVALIVSGLDTLEHVIEQNEQLKGRFLAPIHLPRFDWLLAEHRAEWIGILGAFQEGLSPHFDMPVLDSDEMALRMYCATGGLMGYLTKTLRQTVWQAVSEGRRVITLEHLKLAHLQAVWSSECLSGLPSPFDTSRLLYPSPEVLGRAKAIGTAKAPEPVARKNAAKAVKGDGPLSVGQHLTR